MMQINPHPLMGIKIIKWSIKYSRFWRLEVKLMGPEQNSKWTKGSIGPQNRPQYLIKFNVKK